VTSAPGPIPADPIPAAPPAEDLAEPCAADELSIIVPALNEQDNVGPLVEEVARVVILAGVRAELILVDDGSSDETAARVRALMPDRPWLRLLCHDRRYGQSAAMLTGIRAARSPCVAFLDGDRQNDPADLPAMLHRLYQGDVALVQGDRSANRRDTWVRRASSWVGRTARRAILGDSVRDTGCSTRVLRTDLARRLPLQFRGMHRFIPFYVRMLGGRIVEMPVRHRPRAAGRTKYGIWNRAIPALIDCLVVRWMMARHHDCTTPSHTPNPAPAQTPAPITLRPSPGAGP
jgi:dolichol-phosphate mannosyltransferase